MGKKYTDKFELEVLAVKYSFLGERLDFIVGTIHTSDNGEYGYSGGY